MVATTILSSETLILFKIISSTVAIVSTILSGVFYGFYSKGSSKVIMHCQALVSGLLLGSGASLVAVATVLIYPVGAVSASIYRSELWLMTFVSCSILFQVFISNWLRSITQQILSSTEEEMQLQSSLLSEELLLPSVFNTANTTAGFLVILGVSYCPILVGFTIGLIDWLNIPVFVSYCIYRILCAGSLSSCISGLMKMEQPAYSLSLILYSLVFPAAILLGTFVSVLDIASKELVAVCAGISGALLLYTSLVQLLPRTLAMADHAYEENGLEYCLRSAGLGFLLCIAYAAANPMRDIADLCVKV
eukprot:gene1229-2385_t